MEAAASLASSRQAIAQRLPAPWQVRTGRRRGLDLNGFVPDQTWIIEGPGQWTEQLLVERRTQVGLKQAGDLRALARVVTEGASASKTDPATFLVSTSWLSGPVRNALEDAGVSYVDDTGNMFLRLGSLPVLIRDVGAATNPRPRGTSRAKLGGDQALAVVRYLSDVRPPYSQGEIASATGVSVSYVSKLVRRLEEADLLERTPTSVRDVAWVELLRQRAIQGPPLLATGKYVPMLARRGLEATLKDLNLLMGEVDGYAWVTGSAAANRYAPTAPTAQLALRTSDAARVRRTLGLLPTSGSPDVVLLDAPAVVTSRAQVRDGMPMVALSQVAIDCLGGNGRLPAEGEALLEWMQDNEAKWRIDVGSRPGFSASADRRGLGKESTSYRQSGDWTLETLEAALNRLAATAPVQVAVIEEAVKLGGFVTRSRVYELAGYDASRSLRGFTRPVNRVQRALIDDGSLNAAAPPLLETVYEPGSSQAGGFRIPVPLKEANKRAV